MGGAVIAGAIIGAGIGGGMAMSNDQNILGGMAMGAAGGAAAGYGAGALGVGGAAAGGAAETAALSTGGQLVAAPSAGLAGAPSYGAAVAPAAAAGASKGLIGGMTAGELLQAGVPLANLGVSAAMRPDMDFNVPQPVPPPTRPSVVESDPMAEKRRQESPEEIDLANRMRSEREAAYAEQLAKEERRRLGALVGMRQGMSPAAQYYTRQRTALERLRGEPEPYGQARFGTV